MARFRLKPADINSGGWGWLVDWYKPEAAIIQKVYKQSATHTRQIGTYRGGRAKHAHHAPLMRMQYAY